MKKIFLFLCGVALASPAFSGANWIGGNIIDITSATQGLMVRIDAGVPDNCAGTFFGWMLIPDSARTMVAVTLIARLQNTPVAIYTSGLDASGQCIVVQVDPNG